ncbi:MAG: cell division protein ZapB [Candidatus Babeliales bacterium]
MRWFNTKCDARRGDAMEGFRILEEKVVALIESIEKLRAENVRLLKENKTLIHELDALKKSISFNKKNDEKSVEEKKQAQAMIEDLIKNVDHIIMSMNN